ncbi:MAG: PqqD family protein [Dongiaceae bacterium]
MASEAEAIGGTGRLAVNHAKVAHEIIDGEVLIINTETGAYFSLRGSAAVIWNGIVAGLDAPAIEGRFAGDAEAIRRGVAEVLAQLAAEEVLVPDGSGAPAPADDVAPVPFAPPLVEKFTEMADLLTLDPIHDVDSAGWPYAKDGG